MNFAESKHMKIVAYHADLSYEERVHIQREWNEGTINIIVATIAFGLGVDKPNVRYVVHIHMPQSLEHYVQESV
jgi:bloom syndrome protein